MVGKTRYPRRMKLDPYLPSDIKMDHKLHDMRLDNDCLSTTTKAQAVKAKIDKWAPSKTSAHEGQ